MMPVSFRRAAIALVGVSLSVMTAHALGGCGDDTEFESPDAASDVAPKVDAGNDAPSAEDGGVVYGSCSPAPFEGECASIEVPLDYTKPDGKKIPIYVDRISTSPNAKKVLWMLQGGPGGSGADMVSLAKMVSANRGDLDIYTLDHRGVGNSARLGCSQEPGVFVSEAGAFDDAGREPDAAVAALPCVEELKAKLGDDLQQFTTSNAARDLKTVIDKTKKEGQEIYVYGVSYGTAWAHRYLQIFPDHPTGVILDSIVGPEGDYFSNFDAHGDLVGPKLGELCKADATCNARLGPDPWAHIQSIVATIGTGHCPEVPLTKENRAFLFGYLQQFGLNAYPFAALWRYERCSAQDVAVLKTLAKQSALFNPTPGLFSFLLYYNVRFSEEWEDPAPTDQELRARYDATTLPAGVPFDIPKAIWPTYPKDEFVGKYAVTSKPLLMLNGTLDVQTPIESASKMKDHLNGPHQTFITIPNANHATIEQSPTVTTSGGFGPSCGLELIVQFLGNPQADLDTSCLSRLYPFSWDGTQQANAFFLGTPGVFTGIHTGSTGSMPVHVPVPHFVPRLAP